MASGLSTFKMQWQSLSCNGLEKRGHAAVVVNGKIYSFGGDDGNYSDEDPIDIHVLNTLESPLLWTLLPIRTHNNDFIPLQRYGHTVVASGHLIYLWGGHKCNNQLYMFNTETLEWEKCKVNGEIPANRYYHTASIVRNKMYVFGGLDYDTRSRSNLIKCLDLSTLSWSSIHPKNDSPTPRMYHSATVHLDRFILIFGGVEGRKLCNSVACYDLERSEWIFPEVTGTIPEPRFNHCSFNHNGFMFIFSGYGNSGRLNDLFCYDFENMHWIKVISNGQSPDPRSDSQTVVINNQVLIFGGRNNNRNICDDTFVITFE